MRGFAFKPARKSCKPGDGLREGGDTGSISEKRAGKTAQQVDSLAAKPGPRPQGGRESHRLQADL